jgi:hypothetical protein
MDRFALLLGDDTLRWYAASAKATRGFCGACGSSLFWKPADESYIAVLAGALDPPTGLEIAAHVFVADKADYYELDDDAGQFQQSGHD